MGAIMDHSATDTIKMLWIALGALIISNFGTLIKIYFDNKAAKKIKKDESADKINSSLIKIDSDLQRIFMAVKLLSGKKWDGISKIIQQEIPK